MADDRSGRNEKALNDDRRQRERALAEELDRAEESEPLDQQPDDPSVTPREGGSDPATTRECHRRGCAEPAAFVVLERYQEETGQGAVEAMAALCREHTAEERPTNLDGSYAEYVFRVTPIPENGVSDSD